MLEELVFHLFLALDNVLNFFYSTFADIFDEPHFIKTLQGDVRIVRELPKELESAPRGRKHFTSWSGASYYEETARLWKDYQVVTLLINMHLCYEIAC